MDLSWVAAGRSGANRTIPSRNSDVRGLIWCSGVEGIHWKWMEPGCGLIQAIVAHCAKPSQTRQSFQGLQPLLPS